jgi:aminoglycoside phosphotransferase (APT) family kinase protein
VTKEDAVDPVTATALRDTLRHTTGRPDLDLATPPTKLSGGFYAEMARFRLADPPDGLDGELVARIVPNPALGEWEATIQRAVAAQGFPTPAVRLTAPASSPLGRFLIVMDHIDGRPPLAGLGIRTVAGQIPNLIRRLPDELAGIAARLHSLDPEPLARQLDELDSTIPTATAGFLADQVRHATALGRPDLAAAGRTLIDTEPASDQRVVSHGDLHPFNLLITTDGPVLIDWTLARIAHPAFTLAFTELMLTNPPIPLPAAGAAALRPLGRHIARRFLARYHALAPATGRVEADQLDWHRKVHALRILVETAGWNATGAGPTAGHPWLILEPVARHTLGLGPRAQETS